MIAGVWLPVTVQMAVDFFYRGKLLWAHGALVFFVSVGLVEMGQKGAFITEYLGAMNALQISFF